MPPNEPQPMSVLPSESQVVIIGGGIIGCSVAYHLTKLGWSDVTLLERKTLTCGTTWHSGACIGQLRPSYNMTRLAQYTGQLLNQLEAETGLATGYKEKGALVVTAGQERFTELKRSAAMGQCFGLEVHTLTPSEAQTLWPLLNTDDLVGAVFLPNEGQTNATDTTLSLAKGATMRGARIFEHTAALNIETNRARAVGVNTTKGHVRCEYVVNCTGMWARELGAKNEVRIALQAVEHMYVVTEPMPELDPELPTLRDHNQCIYYRIDAQQMLVGICEPHAKVWGVEGIPDDFAFDQLPEDWDHLEPYLRNAVQRVPALGHAGIKLFLSGPESMTPDTKYLLGETPGLSNHFVAAGFSGVGVGSSGGAGKALAEWIVDGKPSMDLWGVDIRRMMPFQYNQHYLVERVRESNGLLYAMHWPFRQHESARNIRLSAIHEPLERAGACFGEVAGWERANWYAPPGVSARYEYSYGKQNWFFPSRDEHLAVRSGGGFHDLSSDSKFLITGKGALHCLERLCSNRVDCAHAVLDTAWLNEHGGVEALVRIVRLNPQAFLVLADGARSTRDWDWLQRARSTEDDFEIVDVTSHYAEFAIAGPDAAALLASACGKPGLQMSHHACCSLELSYGVAQVFRVIDVGEPSYRILVSTELALSTYQHLMKHGEDLNLKHVGQHAWDSLQIEKSICRWGEVVGDQDTLRQARLTPFIDAAKSGYIGHHATRDSKRPTSQLMSVLLSDPHPQLYGNEPILCHGVIVGYVLSAMYGHSVGGAIGLGYIDSHGKDETAMASEDYAIDIAGKHYSARATLECFYDVQGLRDAATDDAMKKEESICQIGP